MARSCGFTLKVLLDTLHAFGFAKMVDMQPPSYFDLWALATVQPMAEQYLRSLWGTHFPR